MDITDAHFRTNKISSRVAPASSAARMWRRFAREVEVADGRDEAVADDRRSLFRQARPEDAHRRVDARPPQLLALHVLPLQQHGGRLDLQALARSGLDARADVVDLRLAHELEHRVPDQDPVALAQFPPRAELLAEVGLDVAGILTRVGAAVPR